MPAWVLPTLPPDVRIPAAAALMLAYLAGSIPTAYLAGRVRGVDLREHGSGNLGATNAVRVLGARTGALVFAVDALKGLLPVVLLPSLAGVRQTQLLALALGAAAILGHVRPVFLLWRRGGKGVATAAGVFLGVAPVATLLALAVWVVVFAAARYVSLASLAAAVALPVALFVSGHPPGDAVFAAGLLATLFVLTTHRANIGRLRRGEEHRFGKRAGGAPVPPVPPLPGAPAGRAGGRGR